MKWKTSVQSLTVRGSDDMNEADEEKKRVRELMEVI